MKVDNLITWVFMLLALITVALWGDLSMDFQRRCEASCGSPHVLTPIMSFEETCFCDDGDGRWRRLPL